MKNKGLQIALACASGAFIGATIGGTIENTILSYIVGMAIGGFLAYLIYDFNEVLRAVKKVTIPNIKIDKKKMKLRWKEFVQDLVVYISLLSIVLFLLAIIFILAQMAGGSFKLTFVNLLSIYTIFQIAGILIAIFFTVIASLPKNWSDPHPENYFFTRKKIIGCVQDKWVFMLINPIGLPFTVTGLLLFGIGMLFYKMPKIIRYIASKLGQIFIAVHSECRTICLVDAAIGAGTGMYFNYNPIIGAVVGGLLGFLNYYIVSIKILKIKPA